MEPDTGSAVTVASWMEPTVLVALATGIIAILGVVAAFKALTKQEKQIRLLREHDLASWMETFQAYRKQQVTPLANQTRVGPRQGVDIYGIRTENWPVSRLGRPFSGPKKQF